MLDIGYPLEKTIEYHGRTYRLNLAFDAVLRTYDLQRDEYFSDVERITLALEMLLAKPRVARRLPMRDRAELLGEIFKQHITTKPRGRGDDRKLFDFRQDSGYIYSSFLMDYGIDLFEKRGRLDWRVFLALFQGLSDRAKIREVMSIRGRKLPKPNKYNAEEIRNLQELKSYYLLEISAEEAESQFQRDLDKLGAALERRARGG